MKLFRKREKEVDPRTDIEKKFEDKGKQIGLKTGKIVQKSVDKINKVKGKLEEDGTMDKLRNISDKVDDSIDKVVDKVSTTGKQITTKIKEKKQKDKKDTDKVFYE